MPFSSALGWFALLLVPLTACAGWLLRRRKGGFIARMRPHFVLGYAAFTLAVMHVLTSIGGMQGANTNGIRFATVALIGLGLQAFVGTNLQSPGIYRAALRRWHMVLFWSLLVLAIGHIALNASIVSAMGPQ